MGHCSILAEQELQAHKCPHGIATCDFGRVKQMMHVVSPPRVDSGTAGRPVSNVAAARETTTAAGGSLGVASADEGETE